MRNLVKSIGMFISVLLLTLVLVACNGENQDDPQYEVEETQSKLIDDTEEIQEDEENEADVFAEYEEYEQPEISNHNIVEAENFSDGLAWVKLRSENGVENWAVIDTEGRVQFLIDIEPETPFYNGVAMLSDNSIIDNQGNIVVDNDDPRFDTIIQLDRGYIWVERRIDTIDISEIEHGILDNNGEWIHELDINEHFQSAFVEGWAGDTNFHWLKFYGNFLVRSDWFGNIFLLDFPSLNVKLELELEGAQSSFWYDEDNGIVNILHRRVISINDTEYTLFLVSKDGSYEELLFTWTYDTPINQALREGNGMMFTGIYQFGNMSYFHDLYRDEEIELPHLIINEPRFEGEYSFIVIQNEGGVNFATIIDRHGNHLFEALRLGDSYKRLTSRNPRLHEGRVWLQNSEGDFISINTNGETVFSVYADSVNEFQNGFAIIEIGEYYYFIDLMGDKLIVH